MLDDAGHRHHLVAAHHQGPGLALRPRDLGVDEHVLDLLPPSGEAVTGPPASYLKTCQLRTDTPAAPAHLAGELDRPALEPQAVVLAHGLDATAEVDALRADRPGHELRQPRPHR